MLDGVRARYRTLRYRLRRFERHEIRAFRVWIEHTRNLIHLTILLVMPLVIGGLTVLSNAFEALPFLLFPPLASGTYTLFAHPEAEHATPRRFVGGITAGAVCGWLALELSARYWYRVDPAAFEIHAGAAAFGIFLTGLVTWLLDTQAASAYSSALLLLVADVVGPSGTETITVLGEAVSPPSTYVLGVFFSSVLVSGVFVLWRDRFYEQRAQYLYQSTEGDDRVLVPMRDGNAAATAMLAARLAAAHDAGKVVLLSILDPGQASDSGAGHIDSEELAMASPSGGPATAPAAETLERQARRIETQVGIPCQVVITEAGSTPVRTTLQAADETGCNLICTPYETRYGRLAPFIRGLFDGRTDVLVHRSVNGREQWRRVLVPVRQAGNVAHSMIDFATRLAGPTGHVAVCHCITSETRRRPAERMLADLVETVEGNLETRVARSSIEDFLEATAGQYDLVLIGASTDRSTASRFISPPTFERIRGLDCEVAILDRNFRL